MNQEHRIQNQRLFTAAAFNNINMARLALQNGADINTQDHFSRQSPLMVAAMHHHFDLVRFFGGGRVGHAYCARHPSGRLGCFSQQCPCPF
jgi:hypothetical protein